MGRRKKTSESLTKFMSRIISQLKVNGQQRTMLHYQATFNSFMRFRHQQDTTFAELDADMIKSYEAYLKNVAGVCRNTSSFYMRILRAVYKRAVEKGLAPQQHPFKDVYTGIDKTSKRSIPAASVSHIKRLDAQLTSQQELARDTFLMSYYLRGISFIDLAHLRKSDLCDGYLHYTRSKTGQRLSIRWEKDMQTIVDKYKEQTASSPYLFPFLVSDKGKKRSEHQLYHNAESRIAYHLKKLGAKIGLQGKLTLYVARHSWATAARDNDIPVSVISEALGHTSEATTQIYLRSIRTDEVDAANAKLLAAL